MLKPLKTSDDLENIAIKETKIFQPIQYNFVETPRTSEERYSQFKLRLKQLKSSLDEDIVQILKKFCMKEKATIWFFSQISFCFFE